MINFFFYFRNLQISKYRDIEKYRKKNFNAPKLIKGITNTIVPILW